MKVKVFRFRVSNAASSPCPDDYRENWFKERLAELKSEKDIECIINKFLYKKGKKVLDIKVNMIDVEYHNNARGNTIDLVYTILYE